MTEKISLTRALVEVKTLNSRISAAINSQIFVSLSKGRASPRPIAGQFKDIKELENTILSEKQSLDALITRRAKIKSAIKKANVETLVTIADVQMTISDAVDLKESIGFDESIQYHARDQLALASNNIEKNRINMETNVQTSIERLIGADGKTKAAGEQNTLLIEGTKNAIFDMHDLALVDPLDVKKLIKDLEVKISNVKSEIDFVLSEANARTQIEI